jgi:hypothetical protein
MWYPKGGLFARLSPSHLTALIAVVALTALGAGITLYTALPEHQRVNRAAKADALVSSSDLKRLALKVPGQDIAGIDEPMTLTEPVSGTDVFDTNQSCVPPEEVLQRFQADQNVMGGKVVMLADGLQQSFSDAWRLKALVAPVRVSSVVAHLFSIGTDWNVDVVEFDANRCAMSRTLVPGDIWNGLLQSSRAGQV